MTLLNRWSSKLMAIALFVALASGIGGISEVSAYSMISDDTHRSVCRDVYGRRYDWVEQLDPNDVKHTSLVGTAILCDGTDPVLGVELAERACGGNMIMPVYAPVPWWKKPFVKPKFQGWACS